MNYFLFSILVGCTLFTLALESRADDFSGIDLDNIKAETPITEAKPILTDEEIANSKELRELDEFFRNVDQRIANNINEMLRTADENARQAELAAVASRNNSDNSSFMGLLKNAAYAYSSYQHLKSGKPLSASNRQTILANTFGKKIGSFCGRYPDACRACGIDIFSREKLCKVICTDRQRCN